MGGLVGFGQFLQRKGVDRELKEVFFELKAGPAVVYPMEAQLRMLIDANVAGETRVFGLESLAADPLFVHLAGGVVPSVDTVYRDLCRFDDAALTALEGMMARHGFAPLAGLECDTVHLDLDTTVESLFGRQEGALPGPNPRYHGRPSYHPILASVAETRTCVGALLRPGNTGLGEADAEALGGYVRRTCARLRSGQSLIVRVDAGADCAEILQELHDSGAYFIVKAQLSPDLAGVIMCHDCWRSVDWDANGRPITQVAELVFQREAWAERAEQYRVVAVRTRERDVGKQVYLWPDLDYSVQVYITNHPSFAPEDVARDYNGRAEVEPLIAEFKYGWGIGKVPSQDFNANHAMLLLKLLAHNLVRRYVSWTSPGLGSWQIAWLRRVLFCLPARLIRSGRQWTYRLSPHAAATPALE